MRRVPQSLAPREIELMISNGEPYTLRGVSTVRGGASWKPALERVQGAACLLYGHGGPAPAPAHPYIRPAYDTRADESYEIIREGLRDAIDSQN